MEVTNQTTDQPKHDLFNERQKELPGMLNVLTILTFIGCAISYISYIWGYFSASAYQTQMAQFEELQDQMGDNEMASNMMKGSIEMMKKNYEYRYILLASGLIFTTLCLIGAIQMRKLKKSGYPIYVVGELAPIAVTAALVGFSLVGGIATAFSAIIALLFVILYTTQRKHLVR